MANKNDYASRAKIFVPFDALKGYREALKEKEKVVVDKIELSNEMIEYISKVLYKIEKGNMVKIVYYEKNEYIEITGLVSKIDYQSEFIVVVKKKILWNNIYRINVYNEYEEEIEVL